MKKLIFTLTISVISLLPSGLLTAQSTFEFLLEYRVNKWTQNAVEDNNGNFVILVTEGTNQAYGPTCLLQSKTFLSAAASD
jgi:hypothetical protein